jgi:hypothetical protein
VTAPACPPVHRLEVAFHETHHRSTVVFPVSALAKPKQVTISGAPALLVFKTGFIRQCQPVARAAAAFQSSTVIPISNSIAVIDGNGLTLAASRTYDGSVVVLPVFPTSTDSLLGTFLDLAMSFKYLIVFVTSHTDVVEPQKLQEIRIRMYQLFIDVYIAESLFLFNFAAEVLSFLRQMLPTSGGDFVDELPLRLSLLGVYANCAERPYIAQFIEEQQMVCNECMLLPLKSFFLEFQTTTKRREIAQLVDPKCGLSAPAFSASLEESSSYPQLDGHLKRLLKPPTTLEGYPFHLLLHVWARAASITRSSLCLPSRMPSSACSSPSISRVGAKSSSRQTATRESFGRFLRTST